MKPELEQFKNAVEQLEIPGDRKADLLDQLAAIDKKANTLEFRVERGSRDKKTLSALLNRTSEDLETSYELIKKMFGRYLSTEVMNSLLSDPSATALGGERRKVTIMMTDLRGFTALSERLKPEQVVQMLNSYFDVMVDVILDYHGTINEIIGDALLVIFGAPKEIPDRAQRAVACSIEMQNAMSRVNEQIVAEGLPALEMGIGVNEADVVVGNIGSSKRSKYAVVGSGVNMTSRIESYSVGGQILVSESVREAIGDMLRIDGLQEIRPKGAGTPLTIYEIGGIAGRYNLALASKEGGLRNLAQEIPVAYAILEGKDVAEGGHEGSLIRLSRDSAEMETDNPINALTNLRLKLRDVDGRLAAVDFYAKVVEPADKRDSPQRIRFTAMPPEIDAYFQAILKHVTKDG